MHRIVFTGVRPTARRFRWSRPAARWRVYRPAVGAGMHVQIGLQVSGDRGYDLGRRMERSHAAGAPGTSVFSA